MPRSAASRSPIPAAGARDRGHVLCRAGAGAAGRRRRASGLLKLFVETEYLADLGTILATRRRRSPAEQEIWAAHLAVVDGEVGRQAGSGDRPGPVPRPRPRRPRADRGDRRPAAVQHGRHRARSGLRPAPPVRIAPGAIVRIAFWTVVAASARGGARPGRQASRRHRVRAGGARWPGPRRRCSSIISASIPARPACSSARRPPALRRTDAAAVLRHHPARRRRAAGALAHGHFRRPADRAAAHRRHRESRHRRGNCCRRTNTGG